MIEKQALHHYTSFQSCTKKLPFPFKFMCLFIVFCVFPLHCSTMIISLMVVENDVVTTCLFCVFVILLQNLLHIFDLLPFSNFQPNFIVVTNWYIVCISMYLHCLGLQPNTSLFCKKLDHWVKLRLIM
jgi:hypothetical protein